ncbi:hypothetical protein ACFLXP_02690 [Chloroflexota bacterium]
MRISKVSRNIIRLVLAAMICLVLSGFLSIPVQAQTNPVDLELDSAGTTPWVISNIKPGDSGSKTVTLSNIGSGDGFVTIWLSDIISAEGLNPESETGNTAEPGETDRHLQLNLTAEELETNLDLPATINDLPQSVTWPDYIELIPLMAGDTIDLQWDWELPSQTSNEAQGDSISFTINYLLREFETTDVSAVVDAYGVFTEEVIIRAEAPLLIDPEIVEVMLTIEEDVTGETKEGDPISEIWIIDIEMPITLLGDTAIITDHYDCGPDGITFDEPITLTITYDPDDIPPRAHEKDLVIVQWDEDTEEWIELPDYIIDTINNTISVPITHFSRYTVVAPVPPPPSSGGSPAPSLPEEEIIPTRTLKVDILGQASTLEITDDGIVNETLLLSDISGSFAIDITEGTRITASTGLELNRIELWVTDEMITVPENVIVLSPLYRLTGYTSDMEASTINFAPTVTLTIRYNPETLPENTFFPFVASYNDDEDFIHLPLPPDVAVRFGETKAFLGESGLFFAAARVLPPPALIPAIFETGNLTINPQQAIQGQPVIVSLTISNVGDVSGNTKLYLIIDGIVRAVREVTLDSGSTETLEFEVSNLAAGQHQVKIAGLSENFTVTIQSVIPEESKVNWLLIDISVGAALFTGALILYFVTRRPRHTNSIETVEP